MADNRQINEKYAKIGQELIDTEDVLIDVRNSMATIIYLSSDHAKKDKDKLVFGQCEKVADKYKWGIPCDFTITVFEPNVEGFSDEQIKILLFHELLHVGIGYNLENAESYYIRGHDLDDFKIIIDRFGTDWDKVYTQFDVD